MTDAERLLEQANRCCATLYIEARNRIQELDSQDETSFVLTASVHELVKEYRHLPVGNCIDCGDRAPLRLRYCAWGCMW